MESKVCSRSHGQPPGARRRAIIETTDSKRSPVVVMVAINVNQASGGGNGMQPPGQVWQRSCPHLGQSSRRPPQRRGTEALLLLCDFKSPDAPGSSFSFGTSEIYWEGPTSQPDRLRLLQHLQPD